MLAALRCDPNSCSYPYASTSYANPHAVTSVGGTTHTYDNNGNVTAIGSLDYTWDWRNRLAGAERSSGGITSYGYDHTGQRVFKATGTATTSYPNKYYNLATTTGAATTTKHIFAPDGTLLATVVGASTTASTTYLHLDHLGGTNVTTDQDGGVTQTLDYYPYGSQRIASGSFSEQRRFIGEEHDPETEFSYLNARYYSGDRGQFLSMDPASRDEPEQFLADPQQFNSYSYARGNPLILIDTKGTQATLAAHYVLPSFASTLLFLGPVGAAVAVGAGSFVAGYYGTQYLLENLHGAPASSYTRGRLTYTVGSPGPLPPFQRGPEIPKGFWPTTIMGTGLLAQWIDSHHETFNPTGIFGVHMYGTLQVPDRITSNVYISTISAGAQRELSAPGTTSGSKAYINQVVADAMTLNSLLNSGNFSPSQRQSYESSLDSLISVINPNRDYYLKK